MTLGLGGNVLMREYVCMCKDILIPFTEVYNWFIIMWE